MSLEPPTGECRMRRVPGANLTARPFSKLLAGVADTRKP